jgi:hypothetical protein
MFCEYTNYSPGWTNKLAFTRLLLFSLTFLNLIRPVAVTSVSLEQLANTVALLELSSKLPVMVMMANVQTQKK